MPSVRLTIRSSVSNNAYRDLNFGPGFERLAWRGIVAVDTLQKMLWRSRPYERQPGSADAVFELMRQVNRESGTSFLLVTHNMDLARRCDRIIEVVAGRIRA